MMNGKIASAEDLLSAESINPFVHHLELEGTYEKLKTALLTIILLPIRVVIICWLLVAGWFLACIGLWGLTEEDLRTKPVTGWRRNTREMIRWLLLGMFKSTGWWKMNVNGKPASRSEAPILVMAPHSSFFDTLPVLLTGAPALVAKEDTKKAPIIGKLINYTQPVYVWREDPNSRQNTIREIVERATSPEDWPQILIFPEGTCTNRSCLITFKPGAFYPGVPIQPVCIRYPNKLDTVTWTWEGPGAWKLLWLTLTQVTSQCEIEFLPVYRPSEEERRDPRLFASNVRAVMAKALGVPVSDYTYDDCRLMAHSKRLNLPRAHCLPEVQKLRQRLNITNQERRALNAGLLRKHDGYMSHLEFARFLELGKEEANSVALRHLCKLYEKNHNDEEMDVREYLLGVLACEEEADTPLDVLKLACKIYDRTCTGRLSIFDWTNAIQKAIPAVCDEEAAELFILLDRDQQGYITFEMFENFARNKAEFANLFQLSKEEQHQHQQ